MTGTAPKSGLLHARRAAVQALYSMELAGSSMEEALRLFTPDHTAGFVTPRVRMKSSEAFDHFQRTLQKAQDNRTAIDEALAHHLVEEWSLKRLGHVMRALLRAAIGEILLGECEAETVISDYVGIAHDFLAPKEAGMVHALLDALLDALINAPKQEADDGGV